MTPDGATGNAPAGWFDRSPDLVRVWRFPLHVAPGKYAELEKLLSKEETERAGRYHFDRDRRRFTVARGVLRSILAGYLEMPPGKIIFSYGEYGKPTLANSTAPLAFNVSHSHEIGLIAITHNRALGVDVEFQRPMADMEQLLTANFSPREIRAFLSIPPQKRSEAFFAGWTRKEAYLKAKGGGLSVPLNSFSVSMAPNEPAALLEVVADEAEPSRWKMVDLAVAPGYAGALAAEGSGWRFDCLDWNP